MRKVINLLNNSDHVQLKESKNVIIIIIIIIKSFQLISKKYNG